MMESNPVLFVGSCSLFRLDAPHSYLRDKAQGFAQTVDYRINSLVNPQLLTGLDRLSKRLRDRCNLGIDDPIPLEQFWRVLLELVVTAYYQMN